MPSTEPLISFETVATVLGVLAFVAGITKRWVLDPLAEAFGDLEPTAKAVVALGVLVLTVLAISLARWRRRRRVDAARRVVEASAAARPPDATPAG